MARSFLSLLCVGIILTSGSLPAQGKKGNPPGKVEPYTMSVTALKGVSLTDVRATFSTADDVRYPVPGTVKKLQVKVLNDAGDAVYVKNFFDVPVDGQKVTVSVEELEPLMPVLVQAHFKTTNTIDEEVLKAKSSVQLRPDLVIDTVRAPESVRVNTLFSAEVVLAEINGQTGATAKVSLWDGANLIGTAEGITVLAGNMVSVVFEELMLTGVGPHHFTVRIHDADPAEYDTGNNEAEFTVEAVSPMVAVWYSLSYQSQKNHTYYYSYFSPCGYSYSTYENNNYDDFSYVSTFNSPTGLTAPIDSLSLQILSANGTALNVTVRSLTPSFFGADYEEYIFPLQSGSVSFGVTLRAYHSGYATLEVRKYARNYYYRYSSSWGTTVVQQNDVMLGFQNYVEVRMALWDGAYAGGGAASMTLQPFISYGWSNNYSGGWWCPYYVTSYQNYQISSSYRSGYTDPEILPGMQQVPQELPLAGLTLPATTDLVQTYPNPFNPETNIQFSVEHSGTAVLKVFDVLGKEVTELFRGEAEKGRVYQFTFRASGLSSGMYYARLEVGGKQYIQRMILMK